VGCWSGDLGVKWSGVTVSLKPKVAEDQIRINLNLFLRGPKISERGSDLDVWLVA
jgi:hypothetical protein